MNESKNCMEVIYQPAESRRFSVSNEITLPISGIARHWHEEIEFFYVKSGRLVLYIEEDSINLAEGEAVLIPPNLSHRAESYNNSPCTYGTLCFDKLLFSGKGYRRYVQPLMLNGKAYVLKLSGNIGWQKETLRILTELMVLYDLPEIELWELEFHGLIFIMWNKIYKNYYADIPATQSYQKLYRKITGAIDYIHEHYNDEISVDLLAERVNMAVGTFCRQFKQLLGETPFNYLNDYRIRKSRELLVNTDRKISDIAFQCGYNNLSHFNRAFQKYMGCTPTEYRKYETLIK